MKALKFLLITVVVVFLLVIGLVLVILSSAGLQKNIVQRFAPEGLTLEKVHVGLGGIVVEGVRFEENGLLVQLENVHGDFSLLQTLRRRHLHFGELTMANLHIDLTQWEEEPTPEIPPEPRPPRPPRPPIEKPVPEPVEPPTPFEGLFRDDLPWPPLSIDRLKANAEILLPGGHQKVIVTLSGDDIRAETDPELNLSLTYTDISEDAPLSRAALNKTLSLSISPEGIIKGIRIDARIDADVLANETYETVPLALHLGIRQPTDNSAEDYTLTLTLDPESASPLELAHITATYTYAEKTLSGAWTLQADTRAAAALVDPFLQGAWAMLDSTGTFVFDPSAESAVMQGECTIRADRLDLFQPELATVPTVLLEAAFDVSGSATLIEVDALRVELSAPADTLLMALRAEQSFAFDLTRNAAVVPNPEAPLARLTLNGIPVDLVNANLPDIQLALADFTGELLLSVDGDALRVATVRALKVDNLFLAQNGEQVIEDLTLALLVSAEYVGNTLAIDQLALTLNQADLRLLNINVKGSIEDLADDPTLDLFADMDIDLPALLAQPAAEAFRNLAEGRLQGTVKASGTPTALRTDLDLQFTDLLLLDDRRLDQFALKADVLMEEMAHIRATTPLTLRTGDMATDLLLALELWVEDELLRVEAKGSGAKVVMDQLLVLAEAFQNPDFTPPERDVAEEEPRPEVESAPDTEVEEKVEKEEQPSPAEPEPKPLWAGLQADVELDIQELVLPGDMIVRDIVLRAQVDEYAALLKTFEARIDESTTQAKGGLRFRPDNRAKPYRLEADLTVRDFDVGAFLRDMDPDTQPVADAIVSLSGEVQSEAASPELLADALTGRFSVTAADAVVRAFRRGRAGGALDAATTAGRIGGLLTGQQDVEAVSQLITYFNEVTFDELAIEARRNADLTIDLTRLYMRNPDLLIQGTGKVSHEEGREFHQQPIQLNLEMGARPPLARLFDELKLLHPEPGEEGYRMVNRPIEIRGNVNEPDPRPLWAIILEAGTTRILPDRRDREKEEKDGRPDPLERLQRLF